MEENWYYLRGVIVGKNDVRVDGFECDVWEQVKGLVFVALIDIQTDIEVIELSEVGKVRVALDVEGQRVIFSLIGYGNQEQYEIHHAELHAYIMDKLPTRKGTMEVIDEYETKYGITYEQE